MRRKRTPLEQDSHDAFLMGMSYGQFKATYPAGITDKQRKAEERKRKANNG